MRLAKSTLISAGAGSGKTYRIQTDIAQWIKEGKVAADRILAVTFTEAAAAELRHRIREQLIESGLNEQAMQLNQATISTIHGFGLKVLTDYCLDGGLAPDSVLLTEEESNVLLRSALTSSAESDEIIQNFSQFGYKYDFNSKKTASDQFRGRVLAVINNLRLIGQEQSDKSLLSAAEKYLKEYYGKTKNADELENKLHKTVTALLRKFKGSQEELATSNSFKGDLRRDYKALTLAKNKALLAADWSLWISLQNLKVSNRNNRLAEGYDDLVEDIIEAAKNLKFHPGPLQQELKHIQILFLLANNTMKNYSQQKLDAGLLDYTDMLVLADKLLQKQDVLDHIKQRFDCLVIDEFQDTNPMQFALLRRLQQTGIPTLIVGDQKQAIMRFQQADSRLMAALQKQKGIKQESLTENWRTTPELMNWVNAIGQSLFTDEYIKLKAKAGFKSKLTGLEIIEQKAKSRLTTIQYHTALRIKTLLEDEKSLVYDKKTKQYRKIKGSDIAVLHPRSSGLEREADALRELGVNVRIEEDGWFNSSIIQLLYYALSYVADRSDKHAALYMATSELGSYQLQDALNELIVRKELDEPVLSKLDSVSKESGNKDIGTLVNEVVNVLDLHQYISTKGNGKQARANLIRLIAEANTFVSINTSTLNSTGIYGSGLKSFLAWLNQMIEDEDTQPHAQIIAEDAVEMVTWHSAKGREWPVVVVCGLESKVKARFPNLETNYTRFDELDNILKHARIINSPKFADDETTDNFTKILMPSIKRDATCLLYVALTRAREKIILEWPSHQQNKAYSYLHVLQGTADSTISLTEQGVMVSGNKFKANVIQCDKGKPVGYEKLIKETTNNLPVEFRASIKKTSIKQPLTPETIFPSTLHVKKSVGKAKKGKIETIDLKQSIKLSTKLSADEKGTLIHRCLEMLKGDVYRQSLIPNVIDNQLSENDIQQIVDFSKIFEGWLQEKFNPVSIGREVPVLSLDQNNSVVTGFIDLLVETKEGYWILDYKSDRTKDIETRYQEYKPQLELYAEMVSCLNRRKVVMGVGIVWVHSGFVMKEGSR